jgi:hypothetical protein
LKNITLPLLALALSSVPLLAQAPKYVHWNGTGPRFVESPAELPATLQLIFSNLSAPPNVYGEGGWVLAGPNNTPSPGYTEFLGLPFTPSADSHVYGALAPLQYYASGANQVNVSLYSDSDGTPGTLLAGPVTVKDLPDFYSCCKLANAEFASPVAVTAGNQYWIVANTPASGTGSDFYGVWVEMYSTEIFASTNGSTWFRENGNNEIAGAVYGTTP